MSVYALLRSGHMGYDSYLVANRFGFGRTALVTIVAKNRLAHARVLMNSVRKTNPDFARSRWFYFKYSILELSAALKPFFLHWLLCNRGFERIIYLDPDVRAYASLASMVNADQTRIAQRGLHRSSCSHRIGVWTWELEELPPQWDGAFEHCDEIWVPSSFCQAAIGARSPLPVVRIPYCVQPANGNGVTRGDFGIDPRRFVFMNIFDMRGGFARKNALGAAETVGSAMATRLDLLRTADRAD
jgi:hypothetical protein